MAAFIEKMSDEEDSNLKRSKGDLNSKAVKSKRKKLKVKRKEIEEHANVTDVNTEIPKRKILKVNRKEIEEHANVIDVNTEKPKQKNRIVLPTKPEEISANWKKLAETLPKPNPKRKTERSEKTNRKTNEDFHSEIWFDGVDEIFLDKPCTKADSACVSLVKHNSFTGVTKIIAIDCEMVGVGHSGKESALARVSIVNRFGQCIYDKYVTPSEEVTDYRTEFSGIRPKDLEQKGEPFKIVQKEVSDIIKGRVLVGHALHNDLKVLFLDHPRKRIRDTSRYKYFRKVFEGKIPSLKKLTEKLLGVVIQDGEHDSVQDAQAAMRLYTMHRRQWENEIKSKRRTRNTQSQQKNNQQ